MPFAAAHVCPPVANWQDLPIKGDQKEVLLLCEGNFAQIHM